MHLAEVEALALDPRTVLALSHADSSLGRLAGAIPGALSGGLPGTFPGTLSGAGDEIPRTNPHISLDPRMVVEALITREAIASCRIEGNRSSMAAVFQANAFGHETPGSGVRAVQDYISALKSGLGRLAQQPLGSRLLRELHIALMMGVPRRNRQPGQYRRAPGLVSALGELDALLDEDVRLPVLIQGALFHCRFAKLQPFSEGNGEIGRLMIGLHLVQRQAIPLPLLDLSTYFETRRDEYLESMHAVGDHDEIQSWLHFYLTGVAVQATDTLDRMVRLCGLRERYRTELSSSRSRATEVVDLLFVNPVVTIRQVREGLGVTQPGALKLLRGLEQRGWVQNLGAVGRGGRAYWAAPEIMELIESGR